MMIARKNVTKGGSLILLNGASSSGKSSLLPFFHVMQPEVFVLKVDDYWPTDMMQKARDLGWKEDPAVDSWSYLVDYVESKTGKPCFGTEVRAHLFDGISTMWSEAKKLLAEGKNIVMDTVLEYDPEYEKFTAYFKDFDCFKVLVYCPLDILIARVCTRNISGDETERRSLFQSFEQFPALYKLEERDDEQLVDTCSSRSIKQALSIAIQELIDAGISDKYVPRLREFEREFIAEFKLDEIDEIKLVSRHQYELILNSADVVPQQLAKKINLEWQRWHNRPQ